MTRKRPENEEQMTALLRELLAFLAAPILGAMADFSGARRRFLGFCFWTCWRSSTNTRCSVSSSAGFSVTPNAPMTCGIATFTIVLEKTIVKKAASPATVTSQR